MRLTTPRRLTIAAIAAVAALFGAALVATPAAAAPPYIVTNNLSAGQGSLPQEVADAVADGGGTVTFDMTTVTTPINLTAAIPDILNVAVTIQGPGISLLTVNTYNGGRGLQVTGDTASLTMNDISFDSLAAATDGVISTEANIFFEEVSVSGYGGVGVSVVDGQFTAIDSFFSNNGGGGVRWQGNNADADLEGIDFTDVTINNNGAGGLLATSGSGGGNLSFVRVNAQLNNGWAIDIQGPSSYGELLFQGGEYQQNNSGISIDVPDFEFNQWTDVYVHNNEGQGINLDYADDATVFDNVRSEGNGTLSPVSGGGMRLALQNSTFIANNSSFSDNTAAFIGGGVYIDTIQSEASVTFDHTDISGNTVNAGATSNGGGVGVGTIVGNGNPESFLRFLDSTITGNTANGEGGGIFIDHMGNGVEYYGQLYIFNTTIDDNQATTGDGGGISISEFANQSTTEFPFIFVERSTLSNNRAPQGDGGAFRFDKNGSSNPQQLAWVKFENSTISGNTADFAAAGYITSGDDNVSYVQLDIDVSTMTDNEDGLWIDPDVVFTLTNSVVNQDGDATDLMYVPGDESEFFSAYNNVGVVELGLFDLYEAGTGNQLGVDPLLGLLADNGGPTLTHLPQPGSPLFNVGDPAYPATPATDQRGDPRILQGRLDIGSVESLGPLPATGGELNPLWAVGALLFLLAGAALVVARRRAA